MEGKDEVIKFVTVNPGTTLPDADIPELPAKEGALGSYKWMVGNEEFTVDTVVVSDLVVIAKYIPAPKEIMVKEFDWESNNVASASVINNTDENKTIGLFVALYDGEGKLIRVVSQTEGVGMANDTVIGPTDFRVETDSSTMAIKAFLWDMTNNMPLAKNLFREKISTGGGGGGTV